MSRLFESSEINGMVMANRFVRSATWMGLAEKDGEATPELIEKMTELAKGGVGLIITGHAYIAPEGQATPRQIGVYKDEQTDGLGKMSKAVHDSGGKIVLQLAHSGAFAPNPLTGQDALVVSDFEGVSKPPYRAVTQEDIHAIPVAFANAARRAKTAGFDGVQIHAAHAYFLSQFLSPIFNRREDEYGGDIRNRARIVLEVFQAVRHEVGDDFPVMLKINCRDFAENGLDAEDALEVAKMLADAGLDAIELSGGLLTSKKMSPSRPGINTEEKEAYFREDALAFKKELRIPLILVGGVRSPDVAESLLENGTADYFSMSRPFIREPDLISRWKSGDRNKAQCKSDNLCFGPGFKGKGVYCVAMEREAKKGV